MSVALYSVQSPGFLKLLAHDLRWKILMLLARSDHHGQEFIRLLGQPQNLGAQVAGHWQSEVAKRIDIFATALFHGMRIDELNDLDLSYTPPVSSPWDPVQMSAQVWVKHQQRQLCP